MNKPDFSSHLIEMMKWHFSPHTGSPFWLDMRQSMEFNPLHDIRSYSDLALFPDVANLLRDVPVEALIPKGLHDEALAGVFESGGTTGKPKRIVVFKKWLNELVEWRLSGGHPGDDCSCGNTLALIPTGPHIVGAINARRAEARGGLCFTIDLDPRWVKKCIHRKDMSGMETYAMHIIDQAEDILASQSIKYLIATPPILERIAQRPALVAYLNRTLKEITWGGTHMDVDTLEFLQTEIFPDVAITGSYGSTMILGEAKARYSSDAVGSVIFDSFAPFVILDVLDQDTLLPVQFGERGRVIMHHISRYAFFPNTLERDTAIRHPRNDNFPGSSVSDVAPLPAVEGLEVIEGVY